MSNIRPFKAPDALAPMILKHNPGTSREMIASVIRAWGDLLADDPNSDGMTIDMECASPKGQVKIGGSTPISPKPQGGWADKGGLGGRRIFNSEPTTKNMVPTLVKD